MIYPFILIVLLVLFWKRFLSSIPFPSLPNGNMISKYGLLQLFPVVLMVHLPFFYWNRMYSMVK